MKNVAPAVFSIQQLLGHSCGKVLPPTTGWESLAEMAAAQRKFWEGFLDRNGWGFSSTYGIVFWGGSEPGTAHHISSSGRLEVLADENAGTISVTCWAGPSGDRSPAVAASATYAVTGDGIEVVDEFLDDVLVKEKPARAHFLIEIDTKVLNGALFEHTTDSSLRDLFRPHEVAWHRRQALIRAQEDLAWQEFGKADAADWTAKFG